MYLFIGVVVLIIAIVIALKFGDIAESKGHDGTSYFWWTLLLGVVGMLMVAALPDLYSRKNACEKTEEKAPLSRQVQSTSIFAEKKPTAQAISGGWNCTCGRVNASYISTCSCGLNKREVLAKK